MKWNFEYPSARKFGTILELLSRVANDNLVRFKITSDGIFVSQFDSGKIEYCHMLIDKKAFTKYECAEVSDWTLNVEGVKKWLRTAADEESLSCFGSSQGPMYIERTGGQSAFAGKRRLIMPNSTAEFKFIESPKIPKTETAFSSSMVYLLDFLGENPFSNELMTLKLDENGLSAIYIGQNSSYAPTTIPWEERDNFKPERTKLNDESSFDSTILLDVVKKLSSLVQDVLVEFGSGLPLIMSSSSDSLKIQYVVAAKVS
jgi:hypothetical protein